MENTFHYTYSAKENAEVRAIRNKYLPKSESKLEELKRLDNTVQTSGTMESLCVGIGGALIFGLGFCFAAKIIGSGIFLMILGGLVGVIGALGMLAAYPVYRKVHADAKDEYAPRILALAAEISGETTA